MVRKLTRRFGSSEFSIVRYEGTIVNVADGNFSKMELRREYEEVSQRKEPQKEGRKVGSYEYELNCFAISLRVSVR